MRVFIAIVVLFAVFLLGQMNPIGIKARSRSRSRGIDILDFVRREASRPEDVATGRVKRDACSDQCSTFFADENFEECSNALGYILSDDPDSAGGVDSSHICGSSSDDLNCEAILPDAFDCIGTYCTDNNPDVSDLSIAG